VLIRSKTYVALHTWACRMAYVEPESVACDMKCLYKRCAEKNTHEIAMTDSDEKFRVFDALNVKPKFAYSFFRSAVSLHVLVCHLGSILILQLASNGVLHLHTIQILKTSLISLPHTLERSIEHPLYPRTSGGISDVRNGCARASASIFCSPFYLAQRQSKDTSENPLKIRFTWEVETLRKRQAPGHLKMLRRAYLIPRWLVPPCYWQYWE